MRIVQDGFWLNLANVAEGTGLTYVVAQSPGEESAQNIIYRPGPEGHFIYTGFKPYGVRVTQIEGRDTDRSSSRMYDSDDDGGFGSGFASGSRRQGFGSSYDDGSPPRYPSAY